MSKRKRTTTVKSDYYNGCTHEKYYNRVRKAVVKERVVNLYKSMFYAMQTMELTPKQVTLYIWCLFQQFEKRPHHDAKYKEFTEFDDMQVIYANWDKALECELYPPTNKSGFYKDMKKLVEIGLLECLSNGKSHKTKSVYRLSRNWKDKNMEWLLRNV